NALIASVFDRPDNQGVCSFQVFRVVRLSVLDELSELISFSKLPDELEDGTRGPLSLYRHRRPQTAYCLRSRQQGISGMALVPFHGRKRFKGSAAFTHCRASLLPGRA